MTRNERANFGSKLGVILLQPVLQLAWVISGDSLLKQAIMAAQPSY